MRQNGTSGELIVCRLGSESWLVILDLLIAQLIELILHHGVQSQIGLLWHATGLENVAKELVSNDFSLHVHYSFFTDACELWLQWLGETYR